MAAWIGGAQATLDEAVAAAAALLGAARAPVVAGLAADVAGVQAAYRLAESLGGSLDPAGADGLYADLGALAAGGAVTTTPRETIARADLVLAVGAQAASALFQEASGTRPAIGAAAGQERRVLRLAEGGGRLAIEGSLGELRAALAGRMPAGEAVAPVAEALRATRFGVALYDPAELGELAVGMLHGLAADLCATTRFFALSLAGEPDARLVGQVSAWQAGQAPRLGFGRGRAEHDAWRFDAARQIEAGEADGALWLACAPSAPPPWAAPPPLVALVGQASGAEGQVVIRVAEPGVDADGVLIDAATGQLAYRPGAGAAVPAAATVLAAIRAGIERSRGRPC